MFSVKCDEQQGKTTPTIFLASDFFPAFLIALAFLAEVRVARGIYCSIERRFWKMEIHIQAVWKKKNQRYTKSLCRKSCWILVWVCALKIWTLWWVAEWHANYCWVGFIQFGPSVQISSVRVSVPPVLTSVRSFWQSRRRQGFLGWERLPVPDQVMLEWS